MFNATIYDNGTTGFEPIDLEESWRQKLSHLNLYDKVNFCYKNLDRIPDFVIEEVLKHLEPNREFPVFYTSGISGETFH